MNALQALSELDLHPAFKRELAELLELGRELAWPNIDPNRFLKIMSLTISALARLGAQIELRDSLDHE